MHCISQWPQTPLSPYLLPLPPIASHLCARAFPQPPHYFTAFECKSIERQEGQQFKCAYSVHKPHVFGASNPAAPLKLMWRRHGRLTLCSTADLQRRQFTPNSRRHRTRACASCECSEQVVFTLRSRLCVCLCECVESALYGGRCGVAGLCNCMLLCLCQKSDMVHNGHMNGHTVIL